MTDPHADVPLDDGQVDRISTALPAPADPECGLDRILAGQREEHAAAEVHLPWLDLRAVGFGHGGYGGPKWSMFRRGPYDEDAEIDRLRAMVVALENENAALTGPLEALTHEFSGGLSGRCKRVLRFALGGESGCWSPAEHPVHRTPARMRAELEGPL